MTIANGVITEGRFLFLSGMTGAGLTTGDQVESCWVELKRRVEELGGRLENIIQRITFVTSMPEWRAEGSPRQRAWLQANCPALYDEPLASMLIGCAALARPEFKVEI